MRLRAQRDEAALPAIVVVCAVLAGVTVGGGSIQRLGADGAPVSAQPTPAVDEVKATLEREAQKLRANVAALARELSRPEVKRRLGIDGQRSGETRSR